MPHSAPSSSDASPDMGATRIYFLPNLMTAGNLFCGFAACIRCIQAHRSEVLHNALQGLGAHLPSAEVARLPGYLDQATVYYTQAVWLLLAAVVFDSLDGRLARLGGKESQFGGEFDSLADVVSFGLAPALMMFFLILSPSQGFLWFQKVGWFIGFIYLLCGAIRLARFNVLSKLAQAHPFPEEAVKNPLSKDFVGLPIPAAAGVIGSLVLLVLEYQHELPRSLTLALPGLALLVALLMVSTIRYPSFKQVDWNTRTKLRSFIFFLCAIAAVAVMREIALVLIFLGYLLYGIIRHLRLKSSAH